MKGNIENGSGTHRSRWTLLVWAGAGILLLLPLVAMQFSDAVVWGPVDFVVAAVLLFGVALGIEWAVRKTGSGPHRLAVGVTLLAAFTLIWGNAAVGVIGSENNDANLLYAGVLALAAIGALLTRLQPAPMVRVMVATAIAQAAVPVIALIVPVGSRESILNWDVLFLTGFFTTLWAAAAVLFQSAVRR